MPSLQIDHKALEDIRRLRKFLLDKNQKAAERAVAVITGYMLRLETSPHLGAPFDDFRKLSVPFGKSGYLIIYLYNETDDWVRILRVKHGREELDHPEHGR